jgi:sigma-B regulation protein RsbU (phosphoserine phosphatase)
MRNLPSTVRVLIAEDDPVLRTLVGGQIEALGYEVAVAEDGLQAAEMAEREPPDVLVTDWAMPGLNGVDLIHRLRANVREDHYLHVIMMTGSNSEDAIRTGLAAGADDFLQKPINMLKLELGLASAARVVVLQRRLRRRNVRLGQAHDELREAFRTLRRDLQAAAKAQERLLPAPCRTGSLEFDWLFLPSNLVGGDLFDVVPLADGRVFIFHIDVAGHGVPAALRSAFLHDRLSRSGLRGDLAGTAREVSAALLEDTSDDGYCTALLAMVDPAKGSLCMLRAGHPIPRLIHRRSGEILRPEDGGLPLGLLDSEAPPTVETAFGPGDRLFLYSDGLVDCAGADEEPFGEDRFDALIQETAELSLAETIERMRAALAEHAEGSFSDDVSLLVLDNRGKDG